MSSTSRIRPMTFVMFWLLFSMLQFGFNTVLVSGQQPQRTMDFPTFYERILQANPEISRIILKHELFIKSGIVSPSESTIALGVAQRFLSPARYVIQNQQNKVTTVSGSGVTKTFEKKLETEALEIYYNSQSVPEISEVLVISEIALKKASLFFDYVPRRKFGVFLFDSRGDRDRISKYEVHYPNIYVWYSYDINNRKSTGVFLIHELVHMVEIDYLGQHWQWSWLNEGLAEYIANEYFWTTGFLDIEYWKSQGQVPQNLIQIVSGEDWERYRERNYWSVYSQAHSVLEFLIERYGREKVLKLFDYSKTGLSPNDALKYSIGLDMAELEVEWRNWSARTLIDSDLDELNDAREQYYKTNPSVWDTDGDGLSDGLEVRLGTDPTNPDTDGDGLPDGAEVAIAVDGVMRDWDSLSIRASVLDPKDDNKSEVEGTDIASVYAALDSNYLYLAFKLHDKINKKDRVQFCFGIDINGDGKWEYQPGFDLYGNVWLWNLTLGTDYSDLTKVSPIYGSIVAANEIVEFRMPLFSMQHPKAMWIEPYLVVGQGGKHITADTANRFAVGVTNKALSTDPLVPNTAEVTWALRSILEAEEAIRKAEQDGRMQGLDSAKQRLAEATNAFSSGKYEMAASLAKEALELARKASTSTISVTTRTPPETALGSSTANYGMLGLAITIAAIVATAIVLSARRKRRRLEQGSPIDCVHSDPCIDCETLSYSAFPLTVTLSRDNIPVGPQLQTNLIRHSLWHRCDSFHLMRY